MPTLLTADLHLSDNPRDAYRFDFLHGLPALIKKHRADDVLILGDLTEEKDRHGAWLVNQIVAHMARIAGAAPVIITKGNHDYIEADSPFYGFLREVPGIRYVGEPQERNLALGRALLLPHSSNPAKDWKGIPLKADWICCHQTFEGATGGFGRKLEGLPLSTFPKAARVISGDVHVPQSYENLIYVGAPYAVDFGDDYQPRVLLVDKDRARSINLSGPQKRLVEVNNIADLDTIEGVEPGDILKIRIAIDSGAYQDWPKLRARALKWAEEAGCEAHIVQPIIAAAKYNQRKRREDPARTDEELLTEYAKHRSVDDRTLQTGRALL